MARSYWKSMYKTLRGNSDYTKGKFYRAHADLGHKIGKTDYRIPSQYMNEYDNKPVTPEQKQRSKETNEVIEDIALSMAQLGLEIGFKNKAVGKIARTGFGSYRYYRNASRRSGVYRKTNNGRSSGAQKYGNRYRTGTYRRN